MDFARSVDLVGWNARRATQHQNFATAKIFSRYCAKLANTRNRKYSPIPSDLSVSGSVARGKRSQSRRVLERPRRRVMRPPTWRRALRSRSSPCQEFWYGRSPSYARSKTPRNPSKLPVHFGNGSRRIPTTSASALSCFDFSCKVIFINSYL